jgi:hypothetical protein
MNDAPFGDPDAFVRDALSPKPDLVVHSSDRPATVRALLNVLKQSSNLYDRGGVLVMLAKPSDGGLPIARHLRPNNVIVEAHRHCQPVSFDEEGCRKEITLPMLVAQMLLDFFEWDLPPLAGVTTAPLLEPDGSILISSGYSKTHTMWCEPVPDLFVPERPTYEDARTSLYRLRKTFCTFPFAGSDFVRIGELMVVDLSGQPSAAESAFLAALLTACCRPSLRLAPGVLVVAPEISGAGSGKGLLVRGICLIAYGHSPSAFTQGHDRQELDKRLTAALVEAGPAVFLDNVNGTALRSDTLASVLTERPAHVRIMGRTQMVPLNCAAFIALTGNGLSVSEDLARRCLEVRLDPQCEDPEARPFAPGFLERVLAQRAELLSAALTIWRWGRQNPHSLMRGKPLGSYETWAEWVRDPLLTLGCTDPVEQVQEAKAKDPRRRNLEELFTVWWDNHQDQPIAAASLATPVLELLDPRGRGRQYVAARLMQMVDTRAAGFVLTREVPAGKWSAAKYVLLRADTSTSPGTGTSSAAAASTASTSTNTGTGTSGATGPASGNASAASANTHRTQGQSEPSPTYTPDQAAAPDKSDNVQAKDRGDFDRYDEDWEPDDADTWEDVSDTDGGDYAVEHRRRSQPDAREPQPDAAWEQDL